MGTEPSYVLSKAMIMYFATLKGSRVTRDPVGAMLENIIFGA